MIPGYADHAANERTFLAWVRAGVAVIAFGFVIERFDLLLLSFLDTASLEPLRRSQLERLAGPSTHYQGLALIVRVALRDEFRRLMEVTSGRSLAAAALNERNLRRSFPGPIWPRDLGARVPAGEIPVHRFG